MAFVKKQNNSVKAFRKFLSKNNVEEYGIAFQDNPQRKGYTTGEELRSRFYRIDRWDAYDNHGASKHSYLMDYIVIKRQLINGMTTQGNQLKNEIEFYELHKNDEFADVICPILRYGLHRGDRVEDYEEKYYNECYIVSQKAIYVNNAKRCCEKAEELNNANGLQGESAEDRIKKLEKFSNHFKMWDVLHNSGNSGVIFDYEKQCYKAVCIDYAL